MQKKELLAILKKYERQIDDSDYHDVAIFDCDYNRIADEILASLPKEQSVTDEEIEKAAIKYATHDDEYSPPTYQKLSEKRKEGYIEGAKAMRAGQITKIE